MRKKHALSQSRDPDNEYEYTPEEEEAWKELEAKLNQIQQMTKEALQAYLDQLKK